MADDSHQEQGQAARAQRIREEIERLQSGHGSAPKSPREKIEIAENKAPKTEQSTDA
jgi:hypothetical protein